jgi:hypothetical protein
MNPKTVFARSALSVLFLLAAGIAGGCKSNVFTQPVAIASVSDIEPNTPGGPAIQIALNSISSETIVSVTATLSLEPTSDAGPWSFNFGVDSLSPLRPERIVSQTQNLIGGGFVSGTLYPLEIQGTFQNGQRFSYKQMVAILPQVVIPDRG